ncbi:hypothetical protein QN277_014046 [Acacia crassicarpa]|uniref:NIM1-interacting protein n=1 Tax=Acacia crassicarpa TaxID=499986 RepID=A0AAE1N4N3_9FABA|nr:hypothetical protein QN277_014046 [Acacia crassicarpa]
MDGGRRKRRLEGEEEDTEEQKMEKFFALIRSTKEVRDRISNNKKLEEDKFKNVWNPTFQPGDFIHDYQDSVIRSTHLAGPSSDKEVDIQHKESEPIAEAAPPPLPPAPAPPRDEEAHEEDKLDLNLSL